MPVIDTTLQKESRDRYLTYALSVVSGRALPDVRDGLKPVQRRILFAMLKNLGLRPDHTHRKSAAVVGEVLARFHPHGDVACYEAMVRMAQDFSMRYPLVDGQGNFGSLDGDNAAAYRYTEAKLKPIAIDVIGEIDEETVQYRDNFDATTVEPIVLPSRVPNLLINGASGIAVGMATSIPPHNLRETVRALLELSKDAEITTARLMDFIKGPDFPTGCSILSTRKELREMYQSGRGMIRMRGEWEVEEGKRGKRYIVVSSIPYAVNKSQLVEKIASLIIDKKLPQLVDIRDESTDDIRVVLELAPNADPEVAMAYLFKHTPLEGGFPVNLTALVPSLQGGACRPELLSLKDCLKHFLLFREEIVQKRLEFERKQLLARIHILEGLVIIFDDLDLALKIIRSSDGRTDAAEKLQKRFKLSEIQAFAVVDMRVYQLSRTNIEDVRAELKEKAGRVKEIEAILKSPAKITAIVRKDLEDIEAKYGDNRKSKLLKEGAELEFREEDYVVHEDVYAIVTADGWIKRIRQNNELSSTRLREGDSIIRAHPLSTVDSVAFFTNHGSMFVLKVSDFPASGGYGDPIQKTLKFRDGERIVESFGIKGVMPEKKSNIQELPLGDPKPEYLHLLKDGAEVLLVSRDGTAFALLIEGLGQIKRNGKRAMKLREGDELAAVSIYGPKVALFCSSGSALVVATKELPVRDTPAVGVSLIGVRDDDKLIAAHCFERKAKFLLKLSTGKTKEIESGELLEGHRGLKGNKVIARDTLVGVEKL